MNDVFNIYIKVVIFPWLCVQLLCSIENKHESTSSGKRWLLIDVFEFFVGIKIRYFSVIFLEILKDNQKNVYKL